MNTKPRDLCSAAFYGDTDRLRQLIVAAGVYTGRWQPPCHIDTSPAMRKMVEADITDEADEEAQDAGASAAGSPPPSHDIISEEAAEEMAEVMSEEETQQLMSHPQLLRVKQLYSLENVDDEDAAGGAQDGHADEGAESSDVDLFNEAEEEAAEADRQAQEHDLLIYRCVLAEQRHGESVAQRIRQHGFLHTSTTPPVNMISYGILFSCRARGAAAGLHKWETPEDNDEDDADADDGNGDAGEERKAALQSGASDMTSLQVRWQPSKRSCYAGTPLHWAVLARAHGTVAFLVQHGADEEAGLVMAATPGEGAAAEKNEEGDSAAMKVLAQLTPACLAAANESQPTLRALAAAVAARDADRANVAAFCEAIEKRMQRRKMRYVRRRQMAVARRAMQAQQQRDEDERAAAADAEVEEAEDEGIEGEEELDDN